MDIYICDETNSSINRARAKTSQIEFNATKLVNFEFQSLDDDDVRYIFIWYMKQILTALGSIFLTILTISSQAVDMCILPYKKG